MVARALARHGDEAVVFAGLALVLVPIGLVPDGAGAVWRTVRPVSFPASLDRVATTIDAGPADQALVTLPWRSYRNVSWGTGYPSSDPLVRMVDRPVITSDDLAVGDRVVRGESDTAARIGDALATRRPADVLPAYGVGWVVVYADDPAAGDVDVTGLRRVLAAPELTLYAVPGAAAAPEPAPWRRAAVIGADVLALAGDTRCPRGVATVSAVAAEGAPMIAAIVSAVVGAILASAVSLGLVYTATKAPSHNPANQPILTYGQPAT